MKKIASPQDLRSELQGLLEYAQTEQPSRERIASELRGLAERVAATEHDEDLEYVAKHAKAMKESCDKIEKAAKKGDEIVLGNTLRRFKALEARLQSIKSGLEDIENRRPGRPQR